MTVLDNIVKLLDEQQINYKLTHHEATLTSMISISINHFSKMTLSPITPVHSPTPSRCHLPTIRTQVKACLLRSR